MIASLISGCAVVYLMTNSVCAETITAKAAHTSTTLDIRNGAIFECGRLLFGDLAMVFPPEDMMLSNIKNSTLAEIVHRRSYSEFCQSLTEYKRCVKSLVALRPNLIDYLTKVYVDLHVFGTGLDKYCRNETEIVTQFQCTLGTVRNNSCPQGGIFGLMARVGTELISPLTTTQEYCADIKKSIRCRVDEQLNRCDTTYARTMEDLYSAFTATLCAETKTTPLKS